MLQKKVQDIVAPEYRDGVPRRIAAVLREGGMKPFESVDLRKDGARIPVEVSAASIEIEGQRRVIYFLRDTTERKQTKDKLRARTLRGKELAEMSLGALQATDIDALLTEVSTRLRHALQAEFSMVMECLPNGKELMLRASVGWREGLVGRVAVSADSTTPGHYGVRHGIPVIFEDMGEEKRFAVPPLFRDHGIVSGIAIAIGGRERDFGILGVCTTERRTFDDDEIHFLQRVANILSTAIDRKRAEDVLRETQAQLLRTEKLASIGTLVSGVAHEILNPLNAISLHIQMCRKGIVGPDNPEELHEAFDTIHSETERIIQITRNLLDFSRQREPQLKVLDVRTVLDQ